MSLFQFSLLKNYRIFHCFEAYNCCNNHFLKEKAKDLILLLFGIHIYYDNLCRSEPQVSPKLHKPTAIVSELNSQSYNFIHIKW